MIDGSLNPDWVEWLMCWPVGWTSLELLDRSIFYDWKSNPNWWSAEPENIPRVSIKTKDRVSRLKAIGNGQVPMVMAAAWKLLMEVEG